MLGSHWISFCPFDLVCAFTNTKASDLSLSKLIRIRCFPVTAFHRISASCHIRTSLLSFAEPLPLSFKISGFCLDAFLGSKGSTARSNSLVYGCHGSSYRSEVGPCSTILPRYITPTRWLIASNCLQIVRNKQIRYPHSFAGFLPEVPKAGTVLRRSCEDNDSSQIRLDSGSKSNALATAVRCCLSSRKRSCCFSEIDLLQPYQLKHPCNTFPFFSGQFFPDHQWLFQYPLQRKSRIKRCCRFLKDHLNFSLTGKTAAGRRNDPRQHSRKGCFSRTALPHQTKRLSSVNLKRERFYCFQQPPVSKQRLSDKRPRQARLFLRSYLFAPLFGGV